MLTSSSGGDGRIRNDYCVKGGAASTADQTGTQNEGRHLRRRAINDGERRRTGAVCLRQMRTEANERAAHSMAWCIAAEAAAVMLLCCTACSTAVMMLSTESTQWPTAAFVGEFNGSSETCTT